MRINILLFIAISLNSFSQNIQKLEEKNGFRGIKLGSDISNYPSASKEKSFPYSYIDEVNYVLDIRNDSNFDRLENAKILAVYLTVFKEKIREILVVTEYKPYTLELLKLAFGEPNGFGNQWSGKNIYCYYHTSHAAEGKRPDWSWIRFSDKLLSEQFDIEKRAKEEEAKKLEQKRVFSKF